MTDMNISNMTTSNQNSPDCSSERKLKLTESQIQMIRCIAENSFEKLVMSSKREHGSIHWSPLTTKPGVEVCIQRKESLVRPRRNTGQLDRSIKQNNSTNPRRFTADSNYVIHKKNDSIASNNVEMPAMCGFSTCEGSLSEVANLFIGDSTEQMQKWAKTLTNDITDCGHLFTIKPRSIKTNQYIGVKWLSSTLPSRFFENRDFLCVEHQGEFIDTDGTKGWAICLQSVVLDDFPPSQNFVRANMQSSGFVFRESKTPNLLRCSKLIKWNPYGVMPRWISEAGMLHHVCDLTLVDNFLKERKIAKRKVLTKNQLVPTKKRDHCTVCTSKFNSILSRKQCCRICGEVICVKCSKDWQITVPVVGISKIRICTRCIIDIRDIGKKSDFFCSRADLAKTIIPGSDDASTILSDMYEVN